MYWILLIITFASPYQVGHIEILGKYDNKYECIAEQERAIDISNKNKQGPATFSCLKMGWQKTQGSRHVTQAPQKSARRT